MSFVVKRVSEPNELRSIWRDLRSKPWKDPEGCYVGKELELCFFRGAQVHYLWFDGKIVSINAIYAGRKKTNQWEPYANFLLAFTRLSDRNKGFASYLGDWVLSRCGARRVKSLAGTVSGLALHARMGHTAWGLTEKREVLIDSPLPVAGQKYPDGIPGGLRNYANKGLELSPESAGVVLDRVTTQNIRLRYYKEPCKHGLNYPVPDLPPKPARNGTKVAILISELSRPEGATMAELIEALSGGNRPWKEVTVRSGFGWDVKHKGYGVRSSFEGTESGEVERFHLVLPEGMEKHLPHS